MSWVDQLAWQRPWLGLLALAPLLLWLIRPRLDGSRQRLARFIDDHLRPHLLTGNAGTRHRNQRLFIAAWLLAVIAAAGPYLADTETKDGSHATTNVAVVLDISPSMLATDIAPSRLARARLQLEDFVRHQPGLRPALIAFSANAYTVLPLTDDRDAFFHFVDVLAPDLAWLAGSNLAVALDKADQALAADRENGDAAPPGLVLLISDGEIHDATALEFARKLKQHGHRLYALGVGTETGAPIRTSSGSLVRYEGRLVTSRLQRPTLEALAAAGGGHYHDLGTEAWPDIAAAIHQLQQRRSTHLPQQGVPLFPYLIAAALILFVWFGLCRPEALAVLLIAPMLYSPPSDAAPWTEQNARKALEQGEDYKALELYAGERDYSARLGAGVAAYHLHNWQAALAHFEAAARLARSNDEQASAEYNRGNTLVRMQRFEEAAKAYGEALRWQPKHAKANFNLALLKRHEQKWGGERQGKSPAERPGAGGEENNNAVAGGGSGEGNGRTQSQSADQSGRDEGTGQHQGEGEEEAQHQARLNQALSRWSRSDDSPDAPPPHLQQQLENLREDSQTLLRKRFLREDSTTAGLVQEKPW